MSTPGSSPLVGDHSTGRPRKRTWRETEGSPLGMEAFHDRLEPRSALQTPSHEIASPGANSESTHVGSVDGESAITIARNVRSLM